MRIRLNLTVLAAMVALSSVSSQAAEIAYYKFDEAPGATTALPSIGSINGTLAGTSAFVSGGISGNAVSLTRSGGGLVNFGNNFAFTSGDFSMSFWLKTDTTEADSLAISKHFAGSQNGYLFPVGPTGGGGAAGKGNFTVSTITASGVTSSTTINDNVWHQVVGVYSASGMHSIYVDGSPAEESKASSAMVNNAIPFIVGGVGAISTGTPESRYTGLIDELHIFDSALSDNEVQYLFDHPGEPLPEPTALAGIGLFTVAALKRRRRD